MSLRKSAILAILALFTTVLVIAVFIIKFAVLDSFLAMEKQSQQRNVERVLRTLQNRIDWLADTASDWAFWDDTYKFVADLNQAYITTNLAVTTFTSLQLDDILFIDEQGKYIYGKAYDRKENTETAVPESLLAYVTISDRLKFPSRYNDGVAGIISLPEGPAIIASSPIHTSLKTEPARGAFIMVRHLDEEEISAISTAAVVSLTFYSVTAELPAGFKNALDNLFSPSSEPTYTTPIDGNTIFSYFLVTDIYNQPAVILRVDDERTVFQQGWHSAMVSLLLLVGGAAIAATMAIIVQDRRVIRRLTTLRNSVHRITGSGDVSARIDIKGRDEMAGLSEDINAMLGTIEKHREQENKLRQNLELEIQKRSEYTRELVHELKTPITPILSSSELLIDGIKGEPWSRLAKNIYRGALDMNDRLDDLVDIARGEVGILRLRTEPLEILGIIRQMVEEMSPLVKSRSQTLALDVPASLPIIMGDEARLRQVLRNLLSNATKYTPENGIITVRAKRDGTGLVVTIEDTGRGIAQDQLERIFEPYAKITDGILEKQTGLGLGLKLARTLVELHRGRMWVNSEKGKGSNFSFFLPAKQNAGKDEGGTMVSR